MEVILLEKVENLGNLGDQVSVRAGYGRNFLIPKGKATEASEQNMKRFEARRAELEKAQAETLAGAQARAAKVNEAVVTIAANAGNEGRLFGSVNVAEIAAAVSDAVVEIKKQEVLLPNGPIRQVGEYDIKVRLHADIEAQIRVNVVAEE